MIEEAEIESIVRQFIGDNFLYRTELTQLSDSESLLDAGLIDSTGVLELVDFLETEFQITMADEEIVPANLDSITAIVAYIKARRQAA